MCGGRSGAERANGSGNHRWENSDLRPFIPDVLQWGTRQPPCSHFCGEGDMARPLPCRVLLAPSSWAIPPKGDDFSWHLLDIVEIRADLRVELGTHA